MANGGKWDFSNVPASLPKRPGLYINFVEAAIATINGGDRGVVAIPIFTYTGGTAVAGTFYELEGFEGISEANALFGVVNAEPIEAIIMAGAQTVIAYAVPEVGSGTAAAQYAAMRTQFEMEDFNVFVYPGPITDAEQTLTKAWVAASRDEGKHFLYVTGGTALEDATPSLGNTRSMLLDDEYCINLITGVTLVDGTDMSSGEFAPYVAGLIAGTPINRSITYLTVPVANVIPRLKNSEIETALAEGSLVLIKDGDSVLVEQGVTTDGGKIRLARAKQAVATDIPRTARESYIGKVDNEPNGQASLISAVKAYLETLEADRVLLDPEVALDTRWPSIEDRVFLAVAYTEVDSLERIFMTITTR